MMKLVILATIMLQVLAVGVQTNSANLLTCVRRPLWLIRIVLAMFIGVPFLAAALVKLSNVPVEMKVYFVVDMAAQSSSPIKSG